MAQQIEVQTQSEETDEPSRTQEVFRFYELAKKQEWQVGDMPWGALPRVEERGAFPAGQRIDIGRRHSAAKRDRSMNRLLISGVVDLSDAQDQQLLQ